MIEQQINVQEVLVVQESGDCMSDEVCYSGYVEHSDFYIAPQSYQDAFNFLCQLAVESDEDVFYIGKVSENIDDFELYDVVEFRWNDDKGAWVEYDHR